MHDLFYELQVTISQARAGKSTLLIPDLQIGYFRQRSRSCGSKAAYLNALLHRYLPRLSEIKTELNKVGNPNWNTTYQRKGQDLQKTNFVPEASDWELLRNAAAACGVSMCFLFVILMMLEADEFFVPLIKKPPVGRSSSPQEVNYPKKFEKFRKFTRYLRAGGEILVRRLH